MIQDKQPHGTEQENELETVKNEVLRKIGRNVILFQQMEHLLKFILNFNHSTPISKVQENFAAQQESIHRKTMGQLVEPFLSGLVTTKIIPEYIDEPWISFNCSMRIDATEHKQWEERLKAIVDERNQLIHHLLPRWNLSSIDSSKVVEKDLDQQRERILPELDRLKLIFNSIRENLAFYNSEEGKKEIDFMILSQSPLVAWLFKVGKEYARPDGWVALSKAAQIIREHIPQELADLPKHGYENLESILLAARYFDILEELTSKGGIRVVYRIRPGLVFDE